MTRFAICGLGNIGAVHLENLLSLRGCQVSGVYDRRRDLTEAANRKYDVRVFADEDELFRDPETDAVVIATPSSSHRALATRALEHHKHVFVEKPLASSLEDAEAIVAAADRADRKVQVGFCERFNPQFIEARRAVRQRALGTVRAIYSSRVAPFSLGDPNWDLGILDTAVHNLDLILWLMDDRVTSVTARGVRLYGAPPALHSAAITLLFEHGGLATDHITWLRDEGHPLHHCARARFSILGEEGSFEVDLSSRPSSLLRAGAFQSIDTVILGGAGYAGCLKLQFEEFMRSIEENQPVLAPPRDALLAERVVLAAAESLRSGHEVSL